METLHIDGFGCLRTRVDFSPEKLNLAIADNEAGKSTLISSLLAAFYGIVEDERVTRDKRPRRKNVLPWTEPDRFGLQLDFTADDAHWRIERDFNNGIVKLIDRDTNHDHAGEFHKGRGVYNIGEELIGLSCSDFLKSFYLKQEEILEIRDAGGLTPHIQRVATAREGGATSENAIQRLEQALKDYPFPETKGLKIDNAIKRYNTERDNVLEEFDRLSRARADIEPQCQQLSDIENNIRKLRKDRVDNEKLCDLAEVNELNRLVESQEKLNIEHQELTRESEELKEFDQFPANKWEQINNLAGRVTELTTNAEKQHTKIKNEIGENLNRLEKELSADKDLDVLDEKELRDMESIVSRLADRRERLRTAQKNHSSLNEKLAADGVDRERFQRLKTAFSKLREDECRFVEEFRATYAEEEANYREARTNREWIERERNTVLDRRNRILSNTRMFFILAAVMITASGLLILLSEGRWLGQILAGLGLLFAAAGVFIRGTASGLESSRLKKLDEDIHDAIEKENDIRIKLDDIGRNLTELAERIGLADGNEMLAEYMNYDRIQGQIEPLFEAERVLERAREEEQEIIDQVKPFFDRANREFPEGESIVRDSRELLNRYRNVLKLKDETRALTARKDEYDDELKRLERDLDSNRELCNEILRLGSIEPADPLDEAVELFKESLDKHRRYHAMVDEQLPRIDREKLPDVDLDAKRERLNQLKTKCDDLPVADSIKHSKEYYRDQADRIGREIEQLQEKAQEINRRIGTIYDSYQSHQPAIHRRLEEIDEAISKAETFKSEIETTLSIMREISSEVYRSWASALSEDAAPFLKALNPRYDDLRFDEELEFTIHDNHHGRIIPSNEIETVLSSGARDEVFLAARLGIASYLARGANGPIPIVLDEPLSAVDDEKFLTGMRFFLEMLSKGHQVLIMSCHEERHRWLKQKFPKVYSKRVHEIDIVSEETGKEVEE